MTGMAEPLIIANLLLSGVFSTRSKMVPCAAEINVFDSSICKNQSWLRYSSTPLTREDVLPFRKDKIYLFSDITYISFIVIGDEDLPLEVP